MKAHTTLKILVKTRSMTDEPDAGSYHSDSPDEGNPDPETDQDSSGEG